MPAIIADRFTTQKDEPFVVFLIGMQVNKLSALPKAFTVARQFTQMTQVLAQHPEKGYLSGELFFRISPAVTTLLLSYWRSFEDLERFARSKDDPHLAAWQAFVKKVGYDGSLGIWHETYAIEPGKYEVVYANMPLFGLAGATQNAIPVRGGHRNGARGRKTGGTETVPADLELTY